MDGDEQKIRSLVQDWMDATRAGDLNRVLELMDDDVVFIGPGRPPMRGKETYAAQARAMFGKMRVEGQSEIQEVRVFGDWAYSWVQLSVTVQPPDGAPNSMTGPAMSILRRKPDGRWVIFRDANMLTPADDGQG